MEIQLPEKIYCTVKTSHRPVQGLVLTATLKTIYHNPYVFVFGPTDENGSAELNREQILSDASKEQQMGLMDFGPIDKVFSGTVVLSIMDKDDIEQALKAYELYKDETAYPRGYEDMLIQAANVLDKANSGQFKLEASVTPGEIELVTK